MAAHRNIHLSKEVDHLIDGDSEFACHVGNEKLAQRTTSLDPGGSNVEPTVLHFHLQMLRRLRESPW
jgi:hypothetical protein